MDPGSFIILPKLRLREVQKSLFKARRLGTTSTKSQFRGCHEIKDCRRSILNKWKTFPWVIKMNFIPCSYWDALSFCHFSTGPLTPYPIGVSDVGFMGKDRRRSRSRSRRRCRKSMDEVKMVDKWIESQRHIYLERLLHILHRERSLLVFEEFPIVSCRIFVFRWSSLFCSSWIDDRQLRLHVQSLTVRRQFNLPRHVLQERRGERGPLASFHFDVSWKLSSAFWFVANRLTIGLAKWYSELHAGTNGGFIEVAIVSLLRVRISQLMSAFQKDASNTNLIHTILVVFLKLHWPCKKAKVERCGSQLHEGKLQELLKCSKKLPLFFPSTSPVGRSLSRSSNWTVGGEMKNA